MRNIAIILLCAFIAAGCARVKVEAPKDPIKVDISMRLDIYQHVEKDIDAIENIVSGQAQVPQKDNGSFFFSLLRDAYAQDDLSPEVQEAAYRRQARYGEINSLLAKGIIGENSMGFLEARNAQNAPSDLTALLNAENSDRMMIYKSLADKNNITILEIQKIYAEKLQASAPAGSPIEVRNTRTSGYGWQIKK